MRLSIADAAHACQPSPSLRLPRWIVASRRACLTIFEIWAPTDHTSSALRDSATATPAEMRRSHVRTRPCVAQHAQPSPSATSRGSMIGATSERKTFSYAAWRAHQRSCSRAHAICESCRCCARTAESIVCARSSDQHSVSRRCITVWHAVSVTNHVYVFLAAPRLRASMAAQRADFAWTRSARAIISVR